MYTYSKRLTAQLLLFSFLLESCYNPHIGMRKKALPAPAEPAYKQRQYAEEAYDKVNSNPTEQKQLLHICPDEDNSDHIGYVYVDRTPSQAKPNTQLLSRPAARQAAPPSQVGLAQPQQAATSPQQAQEQLSPQAVLALTNPWQQTGRDGQLPPPARARSKPLATPSSESFSHQFDQNKSISAQHTPRKRTHSFKKQNKLLHSQRAAQTKRQRAAAVNEPAQPSPAITPLLPLVTQPPRLADKTPQRIASQDFLAQGGQHVRFMYHDGQWQASVRGRIGEFYRSEVLPVVCERHGDVAKALADLQGKPDKYVQRRIHVLPGQGHHPPMVYIGVQGLKGGMDRAGEASGSGDHQGDRPAVGHEGASGSGLSHDFPRTLELTESKGPTQFELDQIEIKRLKEEIGEKLPQATQEADSQVVHELITRLESLLKLEDFCAPGQGEDGAKEYIARLREDHRSRWAQTAYGADVSKQLTGLLEQAYSQELKRVAPARRVDKTPDGVTRLGKVLGQLAALYQEQGAATGELAYYTDAAVCYQNVLSACEEEAQGYQEQIDAAYSGLVKIREAMLARIKGGKEGVVAQGGMSIARLQEEINSDKQVLKELRADAKARVDKLEAALSKPRSPEEELAGEKEYIEGSRALFGDIAKGVREFLARLYQESEQELGPAPCKYTVMGLGSMALEQMTPYSDLEFAILMEEAKDEAAAREYLRQLTHLVHFRVINLGETVVPESKYENEDKSKYGMSLDHLSKRGLNFDLGGKTPLGRKDKFYDLIQPVAGMLRYLKNERGKIEHRDKLLPFILESTCYVHGDEGLYQAYAGKKSVFLTEGQTEQGAPVYKARALKKLLEGVVEMDYSNPGLGEARHKQGDLADFKPQLGLGNAVEDAGRLYDVKQEIYRLPDRLLYRLAMYYGILPASGWDAVDQLAEKKIIGVGEKAQKASHHLHYAVSFATMLRLRTYLHHGQQAERVTMLSGVSPEQAQQAVSKAFSLPCEALESDGSLFKYYYTALPLHRKMEEFFEALGSRQQLSSKLSEVLGLDKDLAYHLATLFGKKGEVSPINEADFFQAEAFYDDSDETRGNIHRRLLQHEEMKACYERALTMVEAHYEGNHPDVAASLNNVGLAYHALGKPQERLKYFGRALSMQEALYKGNHPAVAASLNNVGSAYQELGKPQEGLKYLERALAMQEALYEGNHPDVATYLNNVGGAYQDLGNLQEGLKYLERALAMREALYEESHPAVATSLNNVGYAYKDLGNPQEGLKYLERGLAMVEAHYEGNHPDVAASLNNVGRVYQELGNPQEGLKYLERGLAMREALYEGSHPEVAGSLNNVGSAYHELGKPQEGLKYLERGLAMREALYEGNHPAVATSLDSVGSAYKDLGKPQEGLKYLERGLAMREAFYEESHPAVATSLNNVGYAYKDLGNPQEGLKYLERGLAMVEAHYEGNHPDVAACLNNVGMAYQELGNPQEGLKYLERGLAMVEALYEGNHPYVAISLNNVGIAYQALGKTQEGLKYYERGLAMREALYEGNHPAVATSLNNVGRAYQDLGKTQEGIKYLERGLAMIESLYEGNHPYVAQSLNNVGGAYNALGKAQEGLKYYERALAMEKALYEGNHPAVATSLNNVGSAYDALGKTQEGLKYLERGLAMKEALYEGNHPAVATSLNNVGSAYKELGKTQEGLKYLERGLAMKEALYEGNHPEVAAYLNSVGSAYKALGKPQEGLKYLERALAMEEAHYEGNHPSVATYLNNVGSAYDALGKPQEGLKYKERGLAMIEALYEGNHPDVAACLNSVGSAYKALGKPQEGLKYLERALAMEEALYEGNHSAVATCLDNVGSAYHALGKPQEGLKYYERGLAMREAHYEGNHPNVAASLNNVGGAYQAMGKPQEGLKYYERGLAMREALYEGNHPNVAASLNNVGSAYQALGKPQEGLKYYERALAMEEALYEENHPEVAAYLNNVGSAYHALGKPQEGLKYLERALAMREALYEGNHPEVAASLNNVGGVYQELGKPQEGLKYYELALAMRKVLYEGNHPDVATSLNNVGSAYGELGKPQEGLKYLERALAMLEALYEGSHPAVAASLNNVGGAYQDLGKPQEGLKYFERALAMQEALYEGNHPEVATCLNNMGSAYRELGNLQEGLKYFERALAMQEALYEGNHPEVATSFNNVGRVYQDLGNPQEGLKYLERALAMEESLYEGNHPAVATSLNNVGSAYHALGKPEEGLTYLERALAMIEAFFKGDHPYVATSLNNVGMAYKDLGKPQEGLKYLERAFHIMKKVYGEDHPSTQEIKRHMEQLSSHLANHVAHQTNQFVKACMVGNEALATSMPMGSFEKDLYDDQDNPLIGWMAQHEMTATLEKVLKLGWNPNLPNTSQAYPLHYAAMKNPGLVRLLLPYADPFVQTAKGSTPAMVAKNKGSMESLSLLLPSITGLSLQDPAAFDTSYASCKAIFWPRQPTHSSTSSRSLSWPAILKTGSWLGRWLLGITCVPSSARSPSSILLLESSSLPVSTPLLRPAEKGRTPSRSLGNLPLKKISTMTTAIP